MTIKGIVAAGHQLTAEAGAQILSAGGNAFDAILAAACAACVAEPVLCSLGGGGFLLAKPAGGKPFVHDFFMQTPRVKQPIADLDFRPVVIDFGTATQEFHIGLGSIATPGFVKGLFEIHRHFGSVPMAEIMQPAIRFAREGVGINALQAYILSIVEPIYLATESARDIFSNPQDGPRLFGQGEVLRLPALADTLEILAIEGDDLFYRGEIAQLMAGVCGAGGGYLTLQDLVNYQVEIRRPLAINYRGHSIATNPPPSCGGLLVAFALQLLQGVALQQDRWGSIHHMGLLADVIAATNKARLDQHINSQGDVKTDILDPDYIELYRRQIYGRAAGLRGTTHISVMDAAGNCAGMTLTNGEGCGSVIAGTGIMLNNVLGEQDLNPNGFHQWQTDQRMASMMMPSLVYSKKRDMTAVIGSGGSNRIRTALLQVLINLIDFEMDVDAAVVAPRIHVEDSLLSIEAGFTDSTVRALAERYQDYKCWPDLNLFFGGAHSVVKDKHGFRGIGDSRRGGVCLRAT